VTQPQDPISPAAPAPAAGPVAAPVTEPRSGGLRILLTGVVAALALVSLASAWYTQHRVHNLEQELVRRQQDSQSQAAEARVLARQADDAARDAMAKSSLLEARISEVSLQRGQLEDLIQSLSRSRDDSVVNDIEAGLRVALQQSSITGSAEPVVATLKAADERLTKSNQPRLEPLRRAIARDLDRVKAASVADIATLAIKLDEATRLVDEVPLLTAEGVSAAASAAAVASAPAARPRVSQRSASPSSAASAPQGASAWWPSSMNAWVDSVWTDVRGLVRVARVDQADAMLLAPDQGWYVRENLKLRLLNARLGLLSRQFDLAQADLQRCSATLDRYFDRSSRKTAALAELLRGVAAQSKQASVPRPDDTLAAIAAIGVNR